MDSFEVNKILGALLGAAFVVFTISLLSDAIFANRPPRTPGYALKAAAPASQGAATATPKRVEISTLLPSADAAKGEAIFKRCQACHDGTKDGPNKVGPNLWGVVGRAVASHPGFSYSPAMKAFSMAGKAHWDYQMISDFITSPRDYVKGTFMTFAGLPDANDRANVIAFLRTLSDDPQPLPKQAAAAGK